MDFSPKLVKERVIFVFAGSESTFDGMGRRLYHSSLFVRQLFQEHDTICKMHNLPGFIELITRNPPGTLSASLVQSQLATVSFNMVMATLWQHWGVQPTAVAGFSLGEFPALVIAGVISLSDMFLLVGKQAEIIVEECAVGTYSVATALGVTAPRIKQLLQHMLYVKWDISSISATQTVVTSGPLTDTRVLSQRLTNEGVTVFTFDVPYAFHSSHMDPVLGRLLALARKIIYAKPRIPYASTLLGRTITEEGIIGAQYLQDQIRYPVEMEAALLSLKDGYADENTTWIECGPQNHISMLIADTLHPPLEQLIVSSSKSVDPWTTLRASVAQASGNGLVLDVWKFQKDYQYAIGKYQY